MSNYKPLMVLVILLAALLVACGPQAGEPGVDEPEATPMPEATPETESADDAITAAATTRLAQELGIAEDEIEFVSAESTEFTDSCLGLGQLNESCLQAITPGWLVMLSAGGQEYEVHTDETGEQVRIAEEGGSAAADPDAATAAAVAQLASELGVAEAEIEVVSLEGAEFSDSCLGLGQLNESCLQAITPGWLVVLSAGGQEYEVHTDETGSQARVALETPEADGAADAIAAAVQTHVAQELGIEIADVEILSVESAEFTDSCLGLGGPDESCLQAMTPGWLVMVNAGGQEYEVHTDETGEQVRVADEPAS